MRRKGFFFVGKVYWGWRVDQLAGVGDRERMTLMKRSLLYLACVAAVGVLPMTAQAQMKYGSTATPNPSSSSAPSSNAAATPSQTYSNDNPAPVKPDDPALARCDNLTGAAKADCVSGARRDYAIEGGMRGGGLSGPSQVKNR